MCYWIVSICSFCEIEKSSRFVKCDVQHCPFDEDNPADTLCFPDDDEGCEECEGRTKGEGETTPSLSDYGERDSENNHSETGTGEETKVEMEESKGDEEELKEVEYEGNTEVERGHHDQIFGEIGSWLERQYGVYGTTQVHVPLEHNPPQQYHQFPFQNDWFQLQPCESEQLGTQDPFTYGRVELRYPSTGEESVSSNTKPDEEGSRGHEAGMLYLSRPEEIENYLHLGETQFGVGEQITGVAQYEDIAGQSGDEISTRDGNSGSEERNHGGIPTWAISEGGRFTRTVGSIEATSNFV